MGKLFKKIGGLVLGVVGAAIGFVAGGPVGAAIGFSIGMGIGTAVQMMAMRTKLPAISSATTARLNVSIDPDEYRKIAFGETALATDQVYWETFGPENSRFDQVIAAAGHEIESFGKLFFDDEEVTFSGDNATGAYAGALTKQDRTVGVTGTALTVGAGAKWTSAASLTGVAHYALRVIWSQEKYPRGIPSRITRVGKGAKVYDPRRDSTQPGGSGSHRANDQSTWEYSPADSNGVPIGRNPALQILWYEIGWRVTNPDTSEEILVCGRGRPLDDINIASFITAANDCEEQEYYSDCLLSTGDAHETNIAVLEGACAGKLMDTGGRISLRIRTDTTGDIVQAFTDGDVLDSDASVWRPRLPLSERWNQGVGSFVDPRALYQLVALPTVRDPAYEAEDGFKRPGPAFRFDAVQDPDQAQALIRLELNLSRYQGVFTAPFNWRAKKVRIWDCVTLTFPRLGFEDKIFRVLEKKTDPMGAIWLLLREDDPSIYTPGTVNPVPAPAPGAGYDPRVVTAPDAGDWTATPVYLEGGGAKVPVIVVSGQPPAANIVATHAWQRIHPSGDWVYLGRFVAGEPISATINGLSPGQEYGIRLEYENAYGVRSEPTVFGPYTVGSEYVVPTAVSAVTVENESIDFAKFAAGIEPVSIVEALPDPEDYVGPSVVFFEGELYRYTGGVWTKKVEAADVDGQLTDEQIAAVDAAKIAGQLTDDQIAAIAATKVTGQLASVQIADAAVTVAKFATGLRPVEIVSALPTTGNFAGRTVFLTTDSKIYRHTGSPSGAGGYTASIQAADVSGQLTNAQLADLAATKITGQIVGTQITDSAISAPKIAAGAVVAGKIAVDAVTANEIAANSIIAAKIAAGAVLADKIAANAVTADKIAANAITAGKIAAGVITAAEIAVGAITASRLAVSNRENLVPDPYAVDEAGWTIGGGMAFSSDATITDTFLVPKGFYVTGVGRGAGAQSLARMLNPQQFFAVEPSTQYRIRALCRHSAGFTGLARATMLLYTRTGALISALGPGTPNYRTAAAGSAATAQLDSIITTPSNAAYGIIMMDVLWSSTLTNAGECWMAAPFAQRAASGELIVDGAVIAEKIAAGAVTTAKLAAGAVTADTIAANAVTAVKLAANSVEAAKIAAGAVTADKVAANAITADKINANAVTTAKIAAGAVTANELAANSVIAGKIAAAAVSADEIAANAITTEKLSVGSFDNLIQNPSFATGFIPHNNIVGTGGGVWSSGADANARTAPNTLAFNTAGQAPLSRLGLNGQHLSRHANVSASAGDQFYFEGWARLAGSGTRDAQGVIVFRNAAGSLLGGSASGSVAATGAWQKFSCSATAPADAAYVCFELRVPNTGSGSPVVYFDDLYARSRVTGELIVDGAITADKIAANAIVAGKIAANAIAALNIAAGAVTADKVNVSTLSAIQANLGTITAGLLRNSGNTFGVNATLGVTVNFVGGAMKVVGAAFGASSDLSEWWGPTPSGATLTDPKLSTLTKTNGYFAMASDGKVYYGTVELLRAPVSASHTGVFTFTRFGTGDANTGSITITPSGGSGGYTYQHSLVITQNDFAVPVTLNSPTSATFSVSAGSNTPTKIVNFIVISTITDSAGNKFQYINNGFLAWEL